MCISKTFEFKQIHQAARLNKVTVNDFLTAALAVAVKRYCSDKQPGSADRLFNLCVPVNVRWARYETFEQVKLENKIAAVVIKIPLADTCSESLCSVPIVTSQLRDCFPKLYSEHLISNLSTLLLPESVNKVFVDLASLPPTLAFSNVPGPLVKLSYKGTESLSGFMGYSSRGKCGLAVTALSHSGQIGFTVVADTGVMTDPEKLRDFFEQAIEEAIAFQPTAH